MYPGPCGLLRGLAAGVPVAEGVEQRVAGVGGDRLLRDAPDRPQGDLQLLEVAPAPMAGVHVLLEAACVLLGQRALEVVGRQLDELLAAHSGSNAARLGSIAPK